MTGLLCLWAALVGGQDEELKRETVNGTVETWYKVTQKRAGEEADDHIGFAREVIRENANKSSYKYSYSLEAEVQTQAGKLSVFFSLSGDLDADFNVIGLSGKFGEGSPEIDFRYVATGEERYISLEPGRRYDLRRDEEIHFFLPLTALVLRQKGKLAKPGVVSIEMFYPKSEQGKNTAPVTLEVKGHREVRKLGSDPKIALENLPPESKAKVTEVAVSGFPTTTKELVQNYVQVDRFGRAILIRTETGIEIAIAPSRLEAVGKEGRVRKNQRRDPFRKDDAMHLAPKTKTVGKTPGKGIGQTTDGTTSEGPVDPAQAVSDLRKRLQEIVQAQKEGADAKAKDLYAEFLKNYARAKGAIRDKGSPEYGDLTSIKREVEESYGGARKLMDTVVRRGVDEIVEAAKRDDLETMEERLKALKKVGEGAEFDESPVRDEFRERYRECEKLVVTTKVRKEFQDLPIELTGTSIGLEDVPQNLDVDLSVLGHRIRVKEKLPFVRSATFARLRIDKTEEDYRVGEEIAVDKDKKLVLVEIARWGVTVSWPEHQRERPSNPKEKIVVPEQLREIGFRK